MTLLIFYVALALGVSFLCSVMEAVLLSVTPAFVAGMEQKRPKYGERLRTMKDQVDKPLAAIQEKYEKVKQMAYLLRTENKNAANADGSMSKDEQRTYLREYEAELVSPEEVALRARGASNAGYHYNGSAKIMAQIGKAFAEATLEMERK